MGWLMSFASVVWIPIVAVYRMWKNEGTLYERLKLLTSPTEEWGPALVKYRKLVDYVPGFVIDPWDTGT
ncbi:hypothetical protein NP493_778g03047 [Ridgeia piscesae]|uniref:Uncharacterized protein n=1 Tax=Ridgeia piscesae TaxID=27915 RepID=A0AAD9NPL7_RIDPI|nr:hypothetical protein NP493_778g03047 [Ridgeia piscesae]